MIAAWDIGSQTPCMAWAGGDGIIHSADFGESKPSEFLLPFLRNKLLELNEPLEALASVIGPGSFTGIRAGIACMLGYELARGTRLYGFNKFELMLAAHGNRDGHYLVPGGRREAFHWRREQGAWLGEPSLSAWNALPEAGERISLEALPIEATRLPGDYARECIAAIQGGATAETHPLQPLYIRDPDAKTQTSLIERLLAGSAS